MKYINIILICKYNVRKYNTMKIRKSNNTSR